MSQQWIELEERIGYRFHNREHLRRALTHQSAINERHGDAANENSQLLEFIGDAALKYAVTTLLYLAQKDIRSEGNLHDQVVSYISNVNLTRIGRELGLGRYIITGRGASDVSDKVFAATVEAILGAIVIDKQEQGHESEEALFDVVAHLCSLKRHGKLKFKSSILNVKKDEECCSCCRCSCCKCFGVFCIISILVAMFIFAAIRFTGTEL